MSKKIIAIAGGTGAQGSGLARAILADPSSELTPRVLTRNPQSEKAQALQKAGAEVVAADVDDPPTVVKAFSGAHGAFCVTFFWEHFSGDKEKAQARSLAEAAKQAGVRHAIWSSLEDTRQWVPVESHSMPTLQEKYKVPHFDAKGEADAYFAELGVPTTVLRTCFYWENMIHFGTGPKPGPDGKLALTMPMGNGRLPAIAAEDIGKCALGIFKAGAPYLGKTIGIAGGMLTGAEMAAALSQALGKEVVYNDVPADVFRSFGFPGADEMGNMYQVKRDFNEQYCNNRSVSASRELNPELLSFEAWLAKYASRIPLE
jgi:uncharacterized protein YbjT (DUF2867 family)